LCCRRVCPCVCICVSVSVPACHASARSCARGAGSQMAAARVGLEGHVLGGVSGRRARAGSRGLSLPLCMGRSRGRELGVVRSRPVAAVTYGYGSWHLQKLARASATRTLTTVTRRSASASTTSAAKSAGSERLKPCSVRGGGTVGGSEESKEREELGSLCRGGRRICTNCS
jgi:hypothetical protein